MEYTGYPISRDEYANMVDNQNDIIFDLRHEFDELKEKLNKSIPLAPKYLIAISKAASAIRFSADAWEWHTNAARNELLEIATILKELETESLS